MEWGWDGVGVVVCWGPATSTFSFFLSTRQTCMSWLALRRGNGMVPPLTARGGHANDCTECLVGKPGATAKRLGLTATISPSRTMAMTMVCKSMAWAPVARIRSSKCSPHGPAPRRTARRLPLNSLNLSARDRASASKLTYFLIWSSRHPHNPPASAPDGVPLLRFAVSA